ncbi:unnamed protein product [Auanema sp. JU1783]|nr:unnamed protein product [Auanema sp. JU1783]
MSSGAILDTQITASSSFDTESTGPQHSRLRLHTGSGAWCPLNQINSTTKEWIEINFNQDMIISAIETEGRYDNGRGMEYAKAYSIEYFRNTLENWALYRGNNGNHIIPGNTDTRTGVLRILNGTIIARKIRIIPVSNSTRTVCLRFEVYGCPYRDIVESYSIPIGSFSDGLMLLDNTYDGRFDKKMQKGGLGKLFDGFIGHDDFEHHPDKWIGWHKDAEIDFIPLFFTFSGRQNISSILIHTNNQFNQLAPAFSSAFISFSLDGHNFSRRAVHFQYKKDNKFENSRWIRIPIPDRIAKAVEIKLYFQEEATWLLISEVKFETNRIIFEIPEEESHEDFVLHHVAENEQSEMFNFHPYLLSLIVFSMIILACGFFAMKRRDRRVKASSPAPTLYNRRKMDTLISYNGTRTMTTTLSGYEMTRESMPTLLEKYPILDSIESEYAEPEMCSDNIYNPLLSSFYTSDETLPMDYKKRNPLSSLVKYSDYGEVYTTTLPEIDRNKLEFVDKVGQGEFGEVHLCRLENRLVAVKRLHSTSEEDEMAFQREIRVLGALKHPNVVEVIAVSTINKPILCVMEYMPRGDLKSYFSTLPQITSANCLSVCTQLAAGLAYLESCNFVHRDVAARNCLVDDEGNVKIADFGMARSLYSSEYYKVGGGNFVLPVRWMSPEALFMGKFSTASDVWSFGITMWEIFNKCQLRPYSDLPDDKVVANLQNICGTGKIESSLPCPSLCASILYHQLILRCLHPSATTRPTFGLIHLNLQSFIHSNKINL